jgi:hypothetical protein
MRLSAAILKKKSPFRTSHPERAFFLHAAGTRTKPAARDVFGLPAAEDADEPCTLFD